MGAKTKIDWADATWNPVTGCLHGCEYCYARGIANRFKGGISHFENERKDVLHELTAPAKVLRGGKRMTAAYPYGFEPTLYRYLLDKPQRWKHPRNIFVCSMADLFGDWVPDEWIQEVFKACEAAPQHRYLFLTKNPARYERLLDKYMPPNMWFGWSQDGPMGDKTVFSSHHSVNTFVSIEPLRRPFKEFHIRGIDWAIVGAETGNRKGKIIPEKKWVDDIAAACHVAGVPLFMKESLRAIMGNDFIQQFPWDPWDAQALSPADANTLAYADNPTV